MDIQYPAAHCKGRSHTRRPGADLSSPAEHTICHVGAVKAVNEVAGVAVLGL